MKLGAYTACLHDRSLPHTLKILQELGLASAEINAGGFIRTPHLPVADLLASSGARDEYLGQFTQAGITLTALNANGNPLSPDPAVGPRHAEDLRQAITLAGLLGVKRVVTMSGLPAAHEGGRAASWVVNPWDSQYLDTLDYPATLERLATELNATHVGAEMDPSHLFWQGIDPVAAINYLGGLVFHAAAKDTRINEENCRVYGVLDDRFQRIPAERNPTGLGGKNVMTQWPTSPSWQFVAVGRGHDRTFWARFLLALHAVDPGMAVNIEHEDTELDQIEGLRQAAENLTAATTAGV